MDEAEQKFLKYLQRHWSLSNIRECIDLVIGVLEADNKQIDRRQLDALIDIRAAEISEEDIKNKRIDIALKSINNYFRSLVAAAIEETIAEKGWFRFDGRNANPFSPRSVEKFALLGRGKTYDDEWEDEQIRLLVVLQGKLADALAKIGYDELHIWVKFSSLSDDDDEVVITDASSVRRELEDVEARLLRTRRTLDDYEAVLNVIKDTGNANLTMWLMKNT